MGKGVSVDSTACSGCKVCMDVCMLGNFVLGEDGKAYASGNGLACFSCGHCVASCPMGAVSHSEIDTSHFEPLDESARPGYEQFLSFLKLRRSRREYKAGSVPRETINKLLRAAVEAPSALNTQSVQYTVITDREVLHAISNRTVLHLCRMSRMMRNPLWRIVIRAMAGPSFEELHSFLPLVGRLLEAYESGKDMILYGAPCAVLLHAPKSSMCAADDAIFNAENILLAAESLGLGTCVIGFVTETANRDPHIKRLTGIPADHKVFSTIIVGYPKFKYSRAVPKKDPVVRYV